MYDKRRTERNQKTPTIEATHGETPRVKKDQTLASTALARLRADIISCRLRPGQRLRFDDLKVAYDIGLSPLREALMRLASEGLVQVEDHRGFRVAPISKNDLLDITFVRQEVEGLSLRLSIELGDDDWEAQILGAFHRLARWESQRIKGGLADPEWEHRHGAFHHALVSACRSPTLLRFRKQLFEQTERYRSASLLHETQERRGVLDEHKKLMEAVLDRDTVAAVGLLQAHLRLTAKLVLGAEPSMFEGERAVWRPRRKQVLRGKGEKAPPLIP